MIVAEGDGTKGSHAEEDENYFISMTDMMVGILFIFIIMLMIFALNFRQQTDQTAQAQQQQHEQANDLADQIAKLRRQIADEINALNKAGEERKKMLEKIKQRLHQVGVEVTVDDVTGALRLTDNAIRFDLESAVLDPKAEQNVDKIAQVLLEVLPDYTACPASKICPSPAEYLVETVFIEGHTDKTGDEEKNWRLSTERAVVTYRRMVHDFPGLPELKNSDGHEILSVSGYAATRPAVKGDNIDAYSKNRRIDLRFVMEGDRAERLNEVLKLLGQMEQKVKQLKNPPPPMQALPSPQ